MKKFCLSASGIFLGFCLATCNPIPIVAALILFTIAMTF